jgi:hypothetical protein
MDARRTSLTRTTDCDFGAQQAPHSFASRERRRYGHPWSLSADGYESQTGAHSERFWTLSARKPSAKPESACRRTLRALRSTRSAFRADRQTAQRGGRPLRRRRARARLLLAGVGGAGNVAHGSGRHWGGRERETVTVSMCQCDSVLAARRRRQQRAPQCQPRRDHGRSERVSRAMGVAAIRGCVRASVNGFARYLRCRHCRARGIYYLPGSIR